MITCRRPNRFTCCSSTTSQFHHAFLSYRLPWQDIIKVYKGDSEVVVAEFQPGTQEGALYQAIHRAYGSGSLRNSEGFCVSDVSPDTGHGIYRFYVDAKGEGHLELSLQRHESPGR